MARYFNPTPSQYVSQFVPPNLDLMYKVAQEKANSDAALTNDLDKAEQDWKVKGGLFTNKQDAELFNQEVESNLSKIRDNFYSGNMDSFQASRALNRLQNVVKNNNKYRLYKLDEQYTKALQPKLVSGELNEALGVPVGGGRNSIDLRGGQLKVNAEIDPNATSEEQLGTWYNAQIPSDFAKEHPDFMHQASIPKIVEKLTKANSNYRLETKTGPNGEIIPIMVNRSNNKEVKGIIEEEVLKYANKYALENYNSTSRQSVDYMRRAGETVNDYAKRLASLIMPGITDLQQSSSTSANIWESGFNLYNKPKVEEDSGTNYPTPGKPTQRGIENASSLAGKLSAFQFGKPVLLNPDNNKLLSDAEIEELRKSGVPIPTKKQIKWENFTDDDKKLISHYFDIKYAETKIESYKRWSKDVISGRDMSWLASEKSPQGKLMMQEMSNPLFLSRLEQVDVLSNNVITDIQYGAENLYKELGIKQSANEPPNLSDLLASNLVGMKFYDITNNKLISAGNFRKEFEDKTPEQKSKIRVGAGKYRSENNLSISIGDGDNWANAYKLNIDGVEYAVQSPKHNKKEKHSSGLTYEQLENQNEALNYLYTNLTLGLPGKPVVWGNHTYFYNDINPDDKHFVNEKNERFNSIYDIFKNQ